VNALQASTLENFQYRTRRENVRKLLTAGALTLIAVAMAITVTACGSKKKSSSTGTTASGKAEVCALLPDTKSSVRYTLFDAPLLQKAFTAAGVKGSVLNAQGDTQTQITQGQQCVTNGAKVILVDGIDSGTAGAIEKAAKAAGVKTIDYDRLTLGGSASYYVSFNNVTVGKLQGEALVAAMKAKGIMGAGKSPVVAELDGAPTDNNATLFAAGAHTVLDPLFKSGALTKGPRQAVPGWDNQKALTIFEQQLTKTGNKIDAVLAANDGLGNAVITALKSHKLKPIPVTGQDATPQGVQNIISGWQSMTVYKAVPLEANAAAAAAIAIIKGTPVKTNGTTKDTQANRSVPSILETPQTINKANYQILFKAGFIKKNEVCVGSFVKDCKTFTSPY
jgi:ABC-type xylose transport system, periplasmic component